MNPVADERPSVAILTTLRRGPATSRELAFAAQTSTDNVRVTIGRLRDRGHGIVNSQPNGTRGIYYMTYDHENPAGRVCSWDGCGQVLARDNDGDRCSLHAGRDEAVTVTGQTMIEVA